MFLSIADKWISLKFEDLNKLKFFRFTPPPGIIEILFPAAFLRFISFSSPCSESEVDPEQRILSKLFSINNSKDSSWLLR